MPFLHNIPREFAENMGATPWALWDKAIIPFLKRLIFLFLFLFFDFNNKIKKK